MTISTGTALLLAFWAGFTYFSRRFMGELYLERPIIAGPVAGLIMGDLGTGLVIGATVELAMMGVLEIGGGVGPNRAVGAVLGVAFAISAGLSAEEALLVALTAAILGSFFQLLAKAASTIFVAGAEKFAEENNPGGITWMVHLGNLMHFLANFIPTFLALQLGSDAVGNIMNSIPAWLENGINVAGSLLPAFGFALLLDSIATTALMPFFFIGFMLAAYFEMGVLGVALAGVLVAAVMIFRRGGINLVKEKDGERTSLVPKKFQRIIYWRSFALQSAFSFDRMQAIGFTWGLIPWLKEIYGKTDRLGQALKRHLTFFNTHPWVAGPAYALSAELEARKAEDDDAVDAKTIQSIKASLMGPLAGIGDPLFHGTLRPILAGIAASFALQGNALGPVLFFVILLAVHLYVRKVTLDVGFNWGDTLFERIDQDSLQRLIEAANITGLVAIGGLVGTWISITTPLTYVSGEGVTVTIQTLLNDIMPKLLPLVVTYLMFYLTRKGVKNNVLMVITLVASLVLGGLGILG
ncbi:PTS system mannose/fructose/sorbose family transporter subunit IID [bacterium]|nr:PTS system mannose/fructose/sorbose family transporter subunit IID [bacterium]